MGNDSREISQEEKVVPGILLILRLFIVRAAAAYMCGTIHDTFYRQLLRIPLKRKSYFKIIYISSM